MSEAVGIVAAGFAAGALLDRSRRRALWGLAAIALGAALLAGRRALSMDAVRAVREDW